MDGLGLETPNLAEKQKIRKTLGTARAAFPQPICIHTLQRALEAKNECVKTRPDQRQKEALSLLSSPVMPKNACSCSAHASNDSPFTTPGPFARARSNVRYSHGI